MNKKEIISSFEQLGECFRFIAADFPLEHPCFTHREVWQQAMEKARLHNPWFTTENLLFAFRVWGDTLREDPIRRWLSRYSLPVKKPKKAGIISAGNIPMVGLHDLLSVWASGHQAVVKLSSDDRFLLPAVSTFLETLHPGWKGKTEFVDKLTSADAIIATGSNNTARYFEYYFSKKPHIIRKNRNAVAIISGNETPEQLNALADDVFAYFGMGCRSVAKIFIPENYDLDKLFGAFYTHKDIIHHHKYYNNYLYHKAIFLMNKVPVTENGFVLLKEDTAYASPVGVLYYEYYSRRDVLEMRLKADRDQIQCIVEAGDRPGSIRPGEAQRPQLWDYADAVDTMEFLTGIDMK